MRAEATFVIDDWKDEPIDDGEGTPRGRAHVAKTFTGDLAATSTAELLLAGTPVEGSRAYVALERVTGRLHGRDGTFLLLHTATGVRGEQHADWVIVADSGTGALTGIAGTATITVDADGGHAFTLDYTLA